MDRYRVAKTEPFTGWDQLREDLTLLGPKRLLGLIVQKVHLRMDEDGLRFVGDTDHSYVNHPILARILIRLICDGVESPRLHEPTTLDEAALIVSALRRINALLEARTGDRYIDLSYRSHDRASIRVLRDSWQNTLEAGPRHNTPKAEIGRTILMLRRFWTEREPDVLKKKGIALRRPLSSAFDDLNHYLWLHILMHQARCVVDDAKRLLGGTVEPEQLLRVVDFYVPEADTVVGSWANIENSDVGLLDNPFVDEPILRLPDGGLVAPDPGLLFAGLPNRFICRVIADYVDDESRGEAARTLVGYAFEEYGRSLLASCGAIGGDQFVPEFELSARGDSPDAFLSHEQTLGQFEFKSKRHPRPTPEVLLLSGYRRWLGEVAGERREQAKPPYQQYVRFLTEWANGDAACVACLGDHADYHVGFYALVSFDGVPLSAHWAHHRALLWGGDLDPAQVETDSIALYLSIAELELLTGIVETAAAEGDDLSALQILLDWQRWQNAGPKAVFGHKTFDARGPLRSYLQETYPQRLGEMPSLVDNSFEQAFAGVASQVYGVALDEVRADD